MSTATLTVRLNHFYGKHPEWWVITAAATAWLVLAITELARETGPGIPQHSGHHMAGMTGMTGTGHSLTTLLVGLGWTSVMVIAMMTPLTAPTIRWIAHTSLRGRRLRAQALFLASYLAVWIITAAALTAAVATLTTTTGQIPTIVITFGAAALWQFTRTKRRALPQCTRTRPLAPRGWRADRDCLWFGTTFATSCVLTCWALMGAAATGPGITVMAPLLGIQLYERLARRPQPQIGAAVTATLGTILTIASLTSIIP